MSDKIDKLDSRQVTFARSASRHRISKGRIRHVIANYRVRFEQPPPEAEGSGVRSMRFVYLGEDECGRTLEVMAVEGEHEELLVIHAMELREKYRRHYEEVGDDQVQDS